MTKNFVKNGYKGISSPAWRALSHADKEMLQRIAKEAVLAEDAEISGNSTKLSTAINRVLGFSENLIDFTIADLKKMQGKNGELPHSVSIFLNSRPEFLTSQTILLQKELTKYLEEFTNIETASKFLANRSIVLAIWHH